MKPHEKWIISLIIGNVTCSDDFGDDFGVSVRGSRKQEKIGWIFDMEALKVNERRSKAFDYFELIFFAKARKIIKFDIFIRE
jgi:hypothetical protein